MITTPATTNFLNGTKMIMKKRKAKETVLIRYHADITKIKAIEIGDWIDLRTGEDVFIEEGEFRAISLGISMELPEGYEAHIAPRSSTFERFGIIQTNGVGIIDNSYCGDSDIWHFPAFCLLGKEWVGKKWGTHIPKNTRICQFRIVESQRELELKEVESLGNADRGGMGSTGYDEF